MKKRCPVAGLAVLLAVCLSLSSCGEIFWRARRVGEREELPACDSLEIYVWQMAPESYRCAMFPGTYREKTFEELLHKTISSVSVEEVKELLAASDVPAEKIVIYPYISTLSSYAYAIDEGYLSRLSALFGGKYRVASADGYGQNAVQVPDDFSLFFRWGIDGISSFDSKTGELIKDRGASDAAKYTATYTPDAFDCAYFYSLLTESIDLFSYPASSYDPYNAPDAKLRLHASPSRTVEITLCANGKTHTVLLSDIALADASECWCEEAAHLVEVIEEIAAHLTATEEWMALPEYERCFL